MRILLIVLTLAAALPTLADSYRFHLTVTDGRTALLSNPDFDKLHLSAEQVESAAKDRVMMLDQTDGMQWRWLMLSHVAKQQTIDASGANGDHDDVGLTASGENAVELRCLHDACEVSIGGETVSLKNGETVTVSSDSHVEVSF